MSTASEATTEGVRARRPRRLSGHMSFWKQFLRPVTNWVVTRRDRVLKAYIADNDGQLRLFVVPKSDGYDSEVTRQLAELVIELTDRGFPVWGSQIPDGPPEELAAFVDVENSILVRPE